MTNQAGLSCKFYKSMLLQECTENMMVLESYSNVVHGHRSVEGAGLEEACSGKADLYLFVFQWINESFNVHEDYADPCVQLLGFH